MYTFCGLYLQMDTHRVTFVTNPEIIVVVFLGTLEKKYLMKVIRLE